MFLIVTISSYTANLAQALISSAAQSPINSLKAALEADQNICYSSGMRHAIEAASPRMKRQGVPMDSAAGSAFAQAVDQGTCQSAIVGELWMEDEWTNGNHCSLHLVGKPIMTFSVGYYVSERVNRAMSLHIMRLRGDGTWAVVEKEMTSATACSQEPAGNNQQMQPYDLLGPLVVLVCCWSTALLIYLFQTIRQCQLTQEQKDLGAELGELRRAVTEQALTLQHAVSTLSSGCDSYDEARAVEGRGDLTARQRKEPSGTDGNDWLAI